MYEAHHLFAFPDDGIFRAALDVWRAYHQQTEDFDQLTCRGRLDDGTAWPATAEERRAVDRNARIVREAVDYALAQIKGLTPEIAETARRAAMGEPYRPPGHPYRLDPLPLPPQRPTSTDAAVVVDGKHNGKSRTF